jgi:putative protein kinase ArgK-like GTPase of G3E family
MMMCCLSVVVNVRIFQGGDDLQMIKRGIMEVADVVLVNKADGATEAAATRAAAEYGGCLRLMPHRCVVMCAYTVLCWPTRVLVQALIITALVHCRL